jgi:hypothetical protein
MPLARTSHNIQPTEVYCEFIFRKDVRPAAIDFAAPFAITTGWRFGAQ